MKPIDRLRQAGAMMLLVAMLAGLLPAHSAYANSRTYDATQPVVMPAPAVRDAFWIANAVERVEDTDRSEMVAFELILQHMYRANPALAADAARARITALQAVYT